VSDEFLPIQRQRLSDSLASRIVSMIQSGTLRSGDRLPTIAEMSRLFRVGAPTLRQALTKLKAMGLVDIRHGSGIYITR
jgi:GntR family transcriptional repressor for pyruvate dehydrogenase complex